MRPYLLSENSWKAIKDEEIEVAVLPWGATEAHNYHLPYGTDNYQIEAIAAEAGKLAWEKGAKLKILPNIPLGVNTGQADIKLDLNLNPSTQLAILADIIEVLNRQGIYKLILLNGHGGNNFKPLLRELGLKYPKMLLLATNFFQVVDKYEFFEEKGDHADEMETSLMLHLKPELVSDLKEAGSGTERKSKITGIREGWAWAERQWSMVSEDTGIGNPKKATKEKGEQFFNAVCRKLAGLFVEVSEVEIDKRYDTPQK
ncbi:creatininase family protein [Zunongwangia sp. F363]|uniref:Creatininase family protein n=1 Tax=Autumnicola tepida TaxID=3075595 RepID=A0ABU3C8Q9_9FLAO|nr:creatininase family protein [Zunongwangia sp. F363]MDT0642716.1 creatininase family protein [Zunongwangia sp. F363]